MSAPITRASISSVTPGIDGDPGAAFAGGLAGFGVGERLDRRRDDDVGGKHRGGNRLGRLSGMRVALRDHGERRFPALALGVDPQQRAKPFGAGIADDQDLLARLHAEAFPDHRGDRPVQCFGRHPRQG